MAIHYHKLLGAITVIMTLWTVADAKCSNRECQESVRLLEASLARIKELEALLPVPVDIIAAAEEVQQIEGYKRVHVTGEVEEEKITPEGSPADNPASAPFRSVRPDVLPENGQGEAFEEPEGEASNGPGFEPSPDTLARQQLLEQEEQVVGNVAAALPPRVNGRSPRRRVRRGAQPGSRTKQPRRRRRRLPKHRDSYAGINDFVDNAFNQLNAKKKKQRRPRPNANKGPKRKKKTAAAGKKRGRKTTVDHGPVDADAPPVPKRRRRSTYSVADANA